ncbi:hypothetical protein V1478_008062, partial [Vespula squamosa]
DYFSWALIACKLRKQDVHFGFYRAPRQRDKHDIAFSLFLRTYISLKLGSLGTPMNHNQIYASHGFIMVRPSASSRPDHASTFTMSLRVFCSVIGELDGAVLETADCINDAQDKDEDYYILQEYSITLGHAEFLIFNLMHATTWDALVYVRFEGQRKLNAYSTTRSGGDSIMALTFGQETNVLTQSICTTLMRSAQVLVKIDTSTRSSLLLLPIEDELIKKKRGNLGLEKCIKDRGSVTLAILRCDRGIVVLSAKKPDDISERSSNVLERIVLNADLATGTQIMNSNRQALSDKKTFGFKETSEIGPMTKI